MKYRFSDFCVCPKCFSDLIESETSLLCSSCKAVYEIRNGIAILLTTCSDDTEKRYFDTYQLIAEDDLKNPFEQNRPYRYQELLNFMGRYRMKNKRILDIGPGNGQYLLELEADFVVALDIAYAYLEHIPATSNVARVCGNAEELPFKPGFFDVVNIAGVMEHLLHPEATVSRLLQISRGDTSIFVEVPWEENLEMYQKSQYEFTHLRSFNNFTFRALWRHFYCRHYKTSYPNLAYPLVFSLEGKIPLFLYNLLLLFYFFIPGISQRDYDWRIKKGQEFPKSTWWLRWFTKPVFKVYEMQVARNWFFTKILISITPVSVKRQLLGDRWQSL